MLPPLIQSKLNRDSRVLVAGAGGGYDVVCGLPLFCALEAAGCRAFLASFSSTPLNDISGSVKHTETLWEVTSDSARPSYFPGTNTRLPRRWRMLWRWRPSVYWMGRRSFW